MYNQSEHLFAEAKRYITGGVNSPVRAFKSVDANPIFIKHAQGATLTDADNNRYVDYIGAWGPMILGHQHPNVIAAVQEALSHGLAYGTPCELETKLAKKVCELLPHIDKVRMVSSGTEATMTAIRLARGVTNKNIIIKFTGCYHGHSDSLLVNAGSGALTLGVPSSPGVPSAIAELTLSLDYNNQQQVQQAFEQHGDDIAAVIIEPIAGNMNLIPTQTEFLKLLSDLCKQFNSLLIFDEVMTGFRVSLGGAQALYGVEPDITTFGKIIGGGMPVGAIAGKDSVMKQLAPEGPIYQAGTLSGNPIAMAAGLATLETITQIDNFYEQLEAQTSKLIKGLNEVAHKNNIEFSCQNIGSMFGLYFSPVIPSTYQEVTECRIDLFIQFFKGMLERGIYLAPSAYEAGFVSYMHSDDDFNKTIESADQLFSSW